MALIISNYVCTIIITAIANITITTPTTTTPTTTATTLLLLTLLPLLLQNSAQHLSGDAARP